MTQTNTKTRPKSRQSSARNTGSRRSTGPSTGSGQRKSTGSTTRRIDELSDAGRKAGLRVVEAYESTWEKVADYEDKLADKSSVDWISDLARAQAKLTREFSSTYGSEARKLIG